jgi:hypothetical protein
MTGSIRHPSGVHEQIVITIRQLQVCWRGALSLELKAVSCQYQLCYDWQSGCTGRCGLNVRLNLVVRDFVYIEFFCRAIRRCLKLCVLYYFLFCFCITANLRSMNRFLLLSDSCRCVDVGHSLWKEDGSIVYKCSWFSQTQSFSAPSLTGLVAIYHCLNCETP